MNPETNKETLVLILKEWLPLIKDVILTGAAIIAGYVGLKGLSTWRRQLKGNTEYILAKQLLTSIYELREAIAGVRHPFMQYSAEPDVPAEKLKELSSREKEWLAKAQAFQKRWEPTAKAKSVLDTTLLEAEVVWGRNIVEKVAPIDTLVSELRWAIQDYLETTNPNAPYEPIAEEIKERRAIMFARDSLEKDEYRKRLEAVIADIEDELKPHIEQYHRTRSHQQGRLKRIKAKVYNLISFKSTSN